MPLTLYGHPFSSYTQKALVALYENDTPFTFRSLEEAGAGDELAALWPLKRFPVLVDGEAVVMEASIIVEHLGIHHPGRTRFVPADAGAALQVRLMDRIFDNDVMTPVQTIVGDSLRPAPDRDAYGVAEARRKLDVAYRWLDTALRGRDWAAGRDFSLADCAAAPFLFYADWTQPIDPAFETLRAYRARLLRRPSFARAVDEARPYRDYFPLGAPDREDLRFARGDAVVELHTEIAITADAALAPTRVSWTERGATTRHDEAYHDAAGWHVQSGAALAADAVPAELVTLYVRRDGRFAGDVFLPARGFVGGAGRVDAVAPGRVLARLALADGALAEATIELDADGTPARVVDGEGVISLRASAAAVAADFPAVDLVAATAIPIGATRRGPRLVLDGALALPALPGQRAQAAAPGTSGLELVLGARLPGALPPGAYGPDRLAEIGALVAMVQARITPDLGAVATSARTAADATAGDCTTYALAYAELAIARGIPTRVVTGLRVDGDRLVRHRWAISWTGRAWIAVDAAFGAAPAGGDLVGLAVHDADDAGLVAGESALTQVRTASWAP